MKKRLLFGAMALSLAIAPLASAATPAVNLTPTPKEITLGEGSLTLPAAFSVKANGLSEEMTAEITKFADALKGATGIAVGSGSDLFTVEADASIAPEGYTLSVTADGVKIKASTPAGLFYAFQTVKKVLPANVCAGVLVEGEYALPFMEIADEPRYPWRGMEIDSARHFWEVDELKKMLDVMATYKMNRFHWHLTDDQGWRLEMAKYPKLTTSATAPLNNYWCDFDNRHSYLLNEPYGPYYYTIDEMKDLVAYAKERHIEVCPEIDMPGHMQAAIAAYPEFSTTPAGDHPVRFWPGVSDDVLDISNPAVVQFTKDIIDQLVDIFPYEYIHIGGDECPTSAWANSTACQEFKKDYGLKSDRAIQNWLTKELAEYAKGHDRKLICWNEVLTSDGADKKMIQDADILIYAWLGAGGANNPSKQAADLGLRSVWCSTSHYYLDYPQWSGNSEPLSMGYALTLETVYKATPDYDNSPSKRDLYYGVNCNLWTEYISEPKHLEYNALPRMIAVAETGWTPQDKKNWNDFLARFNADTEYLDLGNYTYGRHYVNDKAMPEEGKYYRLVTLASNNGRVDRCIELVAEGSSLTSLGAKVGQIWSAPQAAEGDANFDAQYWRFEADPAGSGLYAMVCRASEGGSLDPQMQGSSVDGRWNYSTDTKHYGFVIGDYFGDRDGQHTYSIRSSKGETAYVNCGVEGNGLPINNWANPADGNGGIWFFDLEGFVAPAAPGNPAFTPLAEGAEFSIRNALDEADNQYISASADAQPMLTTADNAAWASRLWQVKESDFNAETNVQTFKLYNPDTNLYLGAPADAAVTSATEASGRFDAFRGNLGFPLSMTADAAAAATVTMVKADADADEYTLTVNSKRLFPISHGSEMLPGAISTLANASRQAGGHWVFNTNPAVTYHVIFTDGSEPMTLRRQQADNDEPLAVGSPLPDYEVESVTNADAEGEYNLVLKRKHYAITYLCVDAKGQLWATATDYAPADAEYTPKAPEIDGLTGGHFAEALPAFIPTEEKTFTAIYETEAYPGVSAPAALVTTLEADKYYLIRDAHADRNAFRCDNGGIVSGAKTATDKGANFVWTLEADGDKWFIKNVGTEAYVQAVKSGTNGTTAGKPYAFTISVRDADAHLWTIKNGKNTLCWDGNENMMMVGWTSPGHPIEFYEFSATPVFKVTVDERDQDGELLASKTQFVAPGASYLFAASARPGKALTSVEGNEGLDNIQANKVITVTYTIDKPDSAINEIATEKGDGVKGIYDLSGRRLSKVSRPGIYIINGVKTTYK